VLDRDRGRCVYCGGVAAAVHHCVPIADGGVELAPLSLLESICAACHAARHGGYQGQEG
jgi:5-methylcytosine-specific restriction endonuclease McrA